jgi:hypothetical protein
MGMKCKVCGRKHGSGRCYLQYAERKKLRKKFPHLSKREIATMARDNLLAKPFVTSRC